MGKSEEYLAKKRNKAARKRLSNTVDFTQGVQAAKRRRKAGRRRICEGMCYSLPSPEDPFNDLFKEKLAQKKLKRAHRDGDQDFLKSKKASKLDSNQDINARSKTSKANKRSLVAESSKCEKPGCNASHKTSEAKVSHGSFIQSGPSYDALSNGQNGALHGQANNLERHIWKPSCEKCIKNNSTWICIGGDAFEVALCTLLNANMVKSEVYENNTDVQQKMLIEKCKGSKWDWLFWEACGTGSDILATGRATATFIQISSTLAAIAHISTRRALGFPLKGPVVLFLVQSKEQTLQVRGIFKLFKSMLGLRAVSLHPQTALEHQIKGLRSTEAQVLVATPERLRELLSVDAVSLANISFMVVDGVEEMVSCGFGNSLLHIKARVADNVQVAVSSGRFPHSTHAICQKLLKDPICRVMSNTSVPQSCECISQKVHILVSEDKRQQKLKNILREHMESRENGATAQGPVVIFRQHQALLQVKVMIQEEAYSVDVLCGDILEKNQSTIHVLEQFRNGQVEVLLAMEDCMSQIDFTEVDMVVLYEFTGSMDFYRQILTRMARCTINGVLYSFCSGSTAPLASQLIDVLQECLQPIPPSLRMLADAAQVIERRKVS